MVPGWDRNLEKLEKRGSNLVKLEVRNRRFWRFLEAKMGYKMGYKKVGRKSSDLGVKTGRFS